MPRPTAAVAAATRTRILDRAAALGSVEGLEGVTQGRLAELAGVSKGGVVRHFPTKEALQLATLEHAVGIFTAEVWAPVAEHPEGLLRLRALLDSWLAYVGSGVFPGGCFLLAVSFEWDDREGPVRAAGAAAADRWMALLEHDVTRAQEVGDLDPGRPAPEIAFALQAVLVGAHWSARTRRDPDAFGHARAAIERVLGPSAAAD